jgi:hypothetical protein
VYGITNNMLFSLQNALTHPYYGLNGAQALNAVDLDVGIDNLATAGLGYVGLYNIVPGGYGIGGAGSSASAA